MSVEITSNKNVSENGRPPYKFEISVEPKNWKGENLSTVEQTVTVLSGKVCAVTSLTIDPVKVKEFESQQNGH